MRQTYLNLETPETGLIRELKYEFEVDTMQVPCDEFSILSELAEGDVTAAEAIVYLALNHASTWDSGVTWPMAKKYLAKKFGKGMSLRYMRSTFDALIQKCWMFPRPTLPSQPARYILKHHRCDIDEVPLDRDGKPKKFAVPRADGGPFERLYAGEISWKACLLWIVLRYYSNWNTAETDTRTLLWISKKCRFAPNTVVRLIKELEAADMLQRITRKTERSCFQLYPRPHPKSEAEIAEKERHEQHHTNRPTEDPNYWYSSKGKYRMSKDSLNMEYRSSNDNKEWLRIPDAARHKIPKSVITEFDTAIGKERARNAARY